MFGPQNLALCEVLGSKCDKNHSVLQGAPPRGRQLYFNFPSSPDPFIQSIKSTLFYLQSCHPVGGRKVPARGGVAGPGSASPKPTTEFAQPRLSGTNKLPKDEVFGPDIPWTSGVIRADIPAQNFGQGPGNTSIFGVNVHDAKARTSTTLRDFQKLRSEKLWAEFSSLV